MLSKTAERQVEAKVVPPQSEPNSPSPAFDLFLSSFINCEDGIA
jgi:hypothetical protein